MVLRFPKVGYLSGTSSTEPGSSSTLRLEYRNGSLLQARNLLRIRLNPAETHILPKATILERTRSVLIRPDSKRRMGR